MCVCTSHIVLVLMSAPVSYTHLFLHNKYINYLITELKPVTGEILRQGAAEGLIVCQQPDALAEIVLLVLVVKLDNTRCV